MCKAGKTESKEGEKINKRTQRRERGRSNRLLYIVAPVGGGVRAHKFVTLKISHS